MDRELLNKVKEADKVSYTQWEENYNYFLEKGYFTKYLDLSFFKSTGRLHGYPTVLVLSGPSVDNHIEELKEIRNKIVLISCDTVVFRLNEEVIIPDFVVSVDPQQYFVDLLTHDIDKTPYLIIPTSGAAKLAKDWEWHIFFFNQADENSDRREFFKNLTKPTSHFITLVNKFFVGMTMFQIAVVMGLHPVTFLGADFCKTDHWYIKGLEEKRHQGKKVEPVFDDEIGLFKTTKQFRHYRDVLKAHILDVVKRKNLKFFSSSDGVLDIENITLKKFAEEYGRDINIKKIVKLGT